MTQQDSDLMTIPEREKIIAEIEALKSGSTRKPNAMLIGFIILTLFAWIIPLFTSGLPNLTAMSAFSAIVGSSILWWESNHMDSQVIQDFRGITKHKKLNNFVTGSKIYFLLAVVVLLIFGIAITFSPVNRHFGLLILSSITITAVVFSGGYIGLRRFSHESYKLQSIVQADLDSVENISSTSSDIEIKEARERIAHASGRSRNALKSTGFFFLFSSGCFVLIDETLKNWHNFQDRLAYTWVTFKNLF